MPKAYWIGRIDVSDLDAYKQYVAANAKAFGKYGAKFLVRGGKTETREGSSRARNVIIEFESLAVAHDCYHSPEYQRAVAIRQKVADGEIVLVEGI